MKKILVSVLSSVMAFASISALNLLNVNAEETNEGFKKLELCDDVSLKIGGEYGFNAYYTSHLKWDNPQSIVITNEIPSNDKMSIYLEGTETRTGDNSTAGIIAADRHEETWGGNSTLYFGTNGTNTNNTTKTVMEVLGTDGIIQTNMADAIQTNVEGCTQYNKAKEPIYYGIAYNYAQYELNAKKLAFYDENNNDLGVYVSNLDKASISEISMVGDVGKKIYLEAKSEDKIIKKVKVNNTDAVKENDVFSFIMPNEDVKIEVEYISTKFALSADDNITFKVGGDYGFNTYYSSHLKWDDPQSIVITNEIPSNDKMSIYLEGTETRTGGNSTAGIIAADVHEETWGGNSTLYFGINRINTNNSTKTVMEVLGTDGIIQTNMADAIQTNEPVCTQYNTAKTPVYYGIAYNYAQYELNAKKLAFYDENNNDLGVYVTNLNNASINEISRIADANKQISFTIKEKEHVKNIKVIANKKETGETVNIAFTKNDDIYSFIMTDYDLELSVEYEYDTFTVSFDTQGGNLIDSVEVEFGKKVSKPTDPVRDGYKFEGWYIGEDEYKFSSLVSEDITLTAKWTKQYKVEFYIDDSTPVKTIYIEDGKFINSLDVPSDPKKESDKKYKYVFEGWYEGDTKFDFSKVIDKDVKLNAKFKAKKKTGCSSSVQSSVLVINSLVLLGCLTVVNKKNKF